MSQILNPEADKADNYETDTVSTNTDIDIDFTEDFGGRQPLYKNTGLIIHSFDEMNEGAQILDNNLVYLYINETAAKQGRKLKSELLGKKMTDVYPGIDKTEMYLMLIKCIEQRTPYNMDNKFYYSETDFRWFSLNFSPVEQGVFILSIDISERKHAENALLNYRLLSENTRDIIFFIDSETGMIIQSNLAARNIYGYDSDEFKNKSILGLRSNPNSGPDLLEMKKHNDEGIIYETIHVDKIGRHFPVEISSRNNIINNKSVIVHIIRDVSERKKYEEEIINLNRLYAVLSDINQIIVRVKDKKILFSEACKIAVEKGLFEMAIVGLLNDDLELSHIESFHGTSMVILDDMNISIKAFKLFDHENFTRYLMGEPIIYNNIDKDYPDNPRKYKLTHNNIHSMAILPIICFGKHVAFFVIYSKYVDFFNNSELNLLNELVGDISFALEFIEKEAIRHEIEEELKKSESKFRYYIEHSPDAIVLTDNNGNIMNCNKAGIDLMGYGETELIGMNIAKLFHPEDIDNGARMFQTLLETGVVSGELKAIRQDGSSYYVLVDSIRVDENSLLGFIKDITELKENQIKLEKAKQKAEEMSRLKSSFLANMSHELRTPMNGILGFSSLISKSKTVEDIAELADLLHKSARRLMDTLNLILDLSRIEAGESKLTPTNVDLVRETSDIIQLFMPLAAMKEIELKFVSKYSSYLIFADLKAIQCILNNIINNAIKFTNKGAVTVTIDSENINEHVYAIIKITDTGIGIDKNNFGLIFEEFRQASEGLERSFEGSGLGLTLVKKYTEMMGGEIYLESELGIGTSVTISLPADNGTLEHSINDLMTQLSDLFGLTDEMESKKWILVVEDDALNMRLVKTIIKDDYFAEYATNSDEALLKASLRNFDAFLMDINLGKSKNGIYTTKKLRDMKQYVNTPIIAMTAYAMKEDKDEFLSEGCSHYISKPFDDEDLLKLLKEIFTD